MPPPWIRDFKTLRTIPVTTPAELNNAVAGAIPGDKIEMAEGLEYTGPIKITRPGSASNAILLTSKGHSKLNGRVEIRAEHNYALGLEVLGGNIAAPWAPGIELFAADCGAINNHVHGINGAVGIFPYNAGARQVVYGNIVHGGISQGGNNPHNIYTQNDYNAHGLKYFIGNVSIDSNKVTSNCYNFHAYTEGGFISGMYLEKNIIAGGKFLIGGFNMPHHHEVINQNYFYDCNPLLGYRRSIQYEFTNNVIGRGMFDCRYHPGKGESDPNLAAPNKITGNKFNYFPFTTYQRLINVVSFITGGVQGAPGLRAIDIVNNNEYHGANMGAGINAAGSIAAVTTIEAWRAACAARGGAAWDKDSTFSTSAGPTEAFFIANEYDPTRGFLAVYNWQNLNSINFNHLGSIAVHNIYDPYGAPIASGVDTVSIPLSAEFSVFLIKLSTDPGPGPGPAPHPLRDQIKVLKDLRAKMEIPPAQMSDKEKKKQTKTTLDAAIPELEKCADEYEPM